MLNHKVFRPSSEVLKKKAMYKNVLQAIDGIEIYPLISFTIFFVFFLGLLVYVALLDKNYVQTMSSFTCSSEDETDPTKGGKEPCNR